MVAGKASGCLRGAHTCVRNACVDGGRQSVGLFAGRAHVCERCVCRWWQANHDRDRECKNRAKQQQQQQHTSPNNMRTHSVRHSHTPFNACTPSAKHHAHLPPLLEMLWERPPRFARCNTVRCLEGAALFSCGSCRLCQGVPLFSHALGRVRTRRCWRHRRNCSRAVVCMLLPRQGRRGHGQLTHSAAGMLQTAEESIECVVST
jgi:hypothetical protein